jgi:hypothetical protein
MEINRIRFKMHKNTGILRKVTGKCDLIEETEDIFSQLNLPFIFDGFSFLFA